MNDESSNNPVDVEGVEKLMQSAQIASGESGEAGEMKSFLSSLPDPDPTPTAPPAGGGSRKNNKKKKRNNKKQAAANSNPQESSNSNAVTLQENPALNLQVLKNALSAAWEMNGDSSKPQQKVWEFWDTQPVPKLGDKVDEIGKIEPDREDVRQTPFSLPSGFYWDTLDLSSQLQLEEVYKLLNENYVEDEDNMFRFDYSADFLQWALRPPGWVQDWHCGVRVKKNGLLVGFISAVPAMIKVYDRRQRMVEINFLCVHKKLRSKRVAPVLIREITRRVNQRGIFQATYTAGVLLPKPVAKCRYFHRPLNPKKLVAIKFSHIGRNQTMQRLLKLMRLPEEPQIKGLRLMENKDVPACHQLLTNHLAKFSLSPVFMPDEVAHYFIPRDGIITTYVVENENNEVTDMASFFTLPSSVMHNSEHSTMKAAYSYYTVASTVSLKDLVKDMLIMAKKTQHDVFNALDLMDNQTYLKDLKFGMGDGNLHYYLYNFKCPEMSEKQVGLVLQ